MVTFEVEVMDRVSVFLRTLWTRHTARSPLRNFTTAITTPWTTKRKNNRSPLHVTDVGPFRTAICFLRSLI